MPSTPHERRRAASYPSGHPSGWFHLLDSVDLAPGQVLAVEALGQDLAVFRTRSGRVHALHARCAHLGASLAGGRVEGDTLVCPFHGWCYDGAGMLQHVPVQDHPPRARVPCLPVFERYGLIFVWNGPTQPDGQPPYQPAYWPELEGGDWVLRGRHRPRDIRTHLLEFAENSVDAQHFAFLHSPMMVPWSRRTVPGVRLRHSSTWALDEARPHLAHFTDDAHLVVLGRDLPRTGAHAHATLVGPASLVMFEITMPELGSVRIAQTHTPVHEADAPLALRVRFTWWAERRLPRALVWYIVGAWVTQWWSDVEVWEAKVHHPQPLLVEADGPVYSLRRWFRQFYPEVSS